MPATSRIVNASKTHPLLAVGVQHRLRGTERGDPALRRAAAVESSTRDDDLRRGCRTSGIRRPAASLAGHAATCETAGAACPAGDLVSPALGCFRFPAAGDLPERQPVQPHCRGDRLDQETFCGGFHGGGTGASRGDEPIFIPPALQSRYRHDAHSVSKAYPSARGEEKPALSTQSISARQASESDIKATLSSAKTIASTSAACRRMTLWRTRTTEFLSMPIHPRHPYVDSSRLARGRGGRAGHQLG